MPKLWNAAISDVVNERCRQVEAEGWTEEHDDQHSDGSLALAAVCYALASSEKADVGRVPDLWPESWALSWWKPKNRRQDLVRAAALLIAEIERLDRAARKELK